MKAGYELRRLIEKSEEEALDIQKKEIKSRVNSAFVAGTFAGWEESS